MANLLRRIRAGEALQLSFDEWASWFSYNNTQYPYGLTLNQTLSGKEEDIGHDFGSLAQQAYKQNGVVFAVMLTRQMLFAEARFQFQQLREGKPGNLFGSPALERLEKPWPGAATSDLLARMIQDADLAGNNFTALRGGNVLRRMRPDWTTIVLGSMQDPDVQAGDLDAEVLGYVYHPGGPNSGRDPEVLGVNEVAHFAPIPDPTASYRGMSWLTPIVRELMADNAATSHKVKFFENGATSNMVVTLDPQVTPEDFDAFVEKFRDDHEGLRNAYKTIFLGGGADVEVVGANFKQIEFKATQGAGETRIAAAGRVPPVIVGLSEGLQAATYSNYGQARRSLADGCLRPLWKNAADSLANIVDVPGGARLWYDDSQIAFLQEDLADRAKVLQLNSISIKQLTDAGYTAESVVDAVTSGDLSRLVHSGLFSVQLQPAGSGENGGGSNGDAAIRAAVERALLDREIMEGDTA